MGNANFSNLLTTVNNLLTAGNTSGAANLLNLLHLGGVQGKVDYKARTMTVAWEQANPTIAPVLMADGFTIIPD
jgi:hypothetical protein